MRESVRDGLWRPGGAFFQIGLGCVMSHHQSPHRRALHIPVLILAGKFKMEFLPTVSHWKGFPVAQICPNLHKIVSSYKGTCLSHIFFPKSHKTVSSSIRAFPVTEICPNLHKIVSSRIRAFPVTHICPNSHKIVSSYDGTLPVAQINPNPH